MVISLLLTAGSSQAEPVPLETGWSNGRKPAEAPEVFSCPSGSYLDSWNIGEGDVNSNVGPLLSVVFIQARCSDGSFLSPIKAGTKASVKHDYQSRSGLSSLTGYSCAKIWGYNNGGNWMMNFLGVGQQLAQDGAGTPLQLKCSTIPTSYVAVGYSAYTGSAVDGINLMMAAVPSSNSTVAATIAAPPGSPEAAAAAAPPAPAAAAATAVRQEATSVKLSTGAIAGIAASALVGLSALMTIAYRAWMWNNEQKLAAGMKSGSFLPNV